MTLFSARPWDEWVCNVQGTIRAEGEPAAEPKPEPIVEPPKPEPPKADATPPNPNPPPKDEPKPEPPKEDWRDKRINQLTAQLAEARRANPEPKPEPSAADFEARVNAKTAEVLFARACEEVANKGKAQFPDFTQRVQQLQRLVNPADPTSAAQYNMFLQAAMDTGSAEAIIHKLGGDLNEAARVMALPVTKMAVELVKLAGTGQAPSNEVSGTPKPITPVGQRGQTHEEISADDKDRADGLSTAEWMRKREAQVRAQAEAR